ncbi:MAG: hypothetical protein ACXACF_06655 [Candidatus Hermodarchaeia archaeon]|jgi:hypothetical protein
MTDDSTSQTLVNVGTWLQIPFSIFSIAIGAWLLWLLYPVLVDPLFWTLFGWYTLILLGFFLVIGFLGLILAIFWFRWRKDILGHKKGLIRTGIVGMIFTGTVPGLLVLLGAALYPTK